MSEKTQRSKEAKESEDLHLSKLALAEWIGEQVLETKEKIEKKLEETCEMCNKKEDK